MDATFSQDGDVVDYTPGSAVACGDVIVLGTLVGVAKSPIAANVLGCLSIVGTFAFPKAVDSSSALAQGALAYWDANNEIMTATSGGNTLAGKVAKAAAVADATVEVRLCP